MELDQCQMLTEKELTVDLPEKNDRASRDSIESLGRRYTEFPQRPAGEYLHPISRDARPHMSNHTEDDGYLTTNVLNGMWERQSKDKNPAHNGSDSQEDVFSIPLPRGDHGHFTKDYNSSGRYKSRIEWQ